MILNLRYTKKFIGKIDNILKKLMLVTSLYPNEEAFIYSLKNIVFAKTRNLKSVLLDIELPEKDAIYYFYKLNSYSKDRQNYLGYQILLTFHHIYLRHNHKTHEMISYLDIHNIHLYDDHLMIQSTMNKYDIFCPNPKLLYVSIERIMKLKKIF